MEHVLRCWDCSHSVGHLRFFQVTLNVKYVFKKITCLYLENKIRATIPLTTIQILGICCTRNIDSDDGWRHTWLELSRQLQATELAQAVEGCRSVQQTCRRSEFQPFRPQPVLQIRLQPSWLSRWQGRQALTVTGHSVPGTSIILPKGSVWQHYGSPVTVSCLPPSLPGSLRQVGCGPAAPARRQWQARNWRSGPACQCNQVQASKYKSPVLPWPSLLPSASHSALAVALQPTLHRYADGYGHCGRAGCRSSQARRPLPSLNLRLESELTCGPARRPRQHLMLPHWLAACVAGTSMMPLIQFSAYRRKFLVSGWVFAFVHEKEKTELLKISNLISVSLYMSRVGSRQWPDISSTWQVPQLWVGERTARGLSPAQCLTLA